jgi:glycosyltransferase involved in cell wall biosynthesis
VICQYPANYLFCALDWVTINLKQSDVSRSVMLVARNEESNIARTVSQVINVSQLWEGTTQICVVDNNSSDNTEKIVAEISKNFPEVSLFRQETNVGYRKNVATGIAIARGDRVFIVDGDGQFDPYALVGIDIMLSEGLDLVLGYREGRAGPRWRRILSVIFLFCARKVIKFDLSDLNSGIRGFSRRFADLEPATIGDSMVNAELYLRARKGHFRVGEFPVAHSNRLAGSSIWSFRHPVKMWNSSIGYLINVRRKVGTLKNNHFI